MSNALVSTIATAVRKYYEDLLQGGVQCRLVIPAPTEALATELQAALLSLDLPSYLVIPRALEPNKHKRWIRPEAVTTVRQNDMVIVVWPGETSRIQDSVVGAGGAIRNFSFSDEWPWIDDGNEYFRFDGPIMAAVLNHWELAEANKPPVSEILRSLLRASQDSLVRSRVFLDEIICGFTSVTPLLPEIERLLYCAGIPYSNDVDWNDPVEIKGYFGEVRRVLQSLHNRLREPGARTELLERVDELAKDVSVKEALRKSIAFTIDTSTSKGDEGLGDILMLYGAWDSPASWKAWSLDLLRQLIDLPPNHERVIMSVKPAVSAGRVSESGNAVVLVEHGTVALEVEYAGLVESAGVFMLLKDRTTEIAGTTISSNYGKHHFEVSYGDLFPEGNRSPKKVIRVLLSRGGAELAVWRVTVHRVDQLYHLVTVVEPKFQIFSGRKSYEGPVEDQPVEKFTVAEPVFVTAIAYSETVECFIDEKLVSDEEIVQSGPVFQLTDPIDPTLHGGGSSLIVVRSGDQECLVEIEARDVARGKFTLEGELIAKLSSAGAQAAVRRLLAVFKNPLAHRYPGLGALDEAARSRIVLGRLFELRQDGKPVVYDIGSSEELYAPKESALAICGSLGAEEAFSGVAPAEVIPLLEEYTSARSAVIALLHADQDGRAHWPLYASEPVYSDECADAVENAIHDFLRAYTEMIAFARQRPVQLDRGVMARLILSDCVIHWDGQEHSQEMILLGPYHPLVLAKRFMVQRALVLYAKRRIEDTTNVSSPLAVLLDQLDSFRWYAVPAGLGGMFENFYVSASSDPGWLVAFAHDVLGTAKFDDHIATLKRNLGIDVALVPSAKAQIAQGYFKDFFNAFPTRRSISVAADKSYSTERLVESAQALLFANDEISEIGAQLPGGIHIAVSADDPLAEQEWREPHVCVYRVNADEGQAEFSDIELISSGSVKTHRDEDAASLARGRDLNSVFVSPMREVEKPAGGALTSKLYERDIDARSDTTMGGAYAEACRLIGGLPAENRVLYWTADVPTKLRRLWTVIPGSHVDPAVFVKYVAGQFASGESAALWDYSVSLTGAVNSYFVLSKIPASVIHELNKSPVLAGHPLAPGVLHELGQVGVALGSESLRSGSKALGVIGVVAAVRLFLTNCKAQGFIRQGPAQTGFMLPVDSFREVLGGAGEPPEANGKRADLVALQLAVLPSGAVGISCTAVECKYTTVGLTADNEAQALGQAAATLARVQHLVAAARLDSGIPERLALLELISFGLRLSVASPHGQISRSLETDIRQRILEGSIQAFEARHPKIAVITDCNITAAGWKKTSEGMVIKVGKGCWPGLNDTLELANIATEIAKNFDALTDSINGNSGPAEHSIHGSLPIAPPVHAPNEAFPAGHGTSQAGPLLPLKPVLLGTFAGTGVAYSYDPQSVSRPLDNYNAMITGSSGKGKTQLIKAFILGLREQERSTLILDFKNDFASDSYFLTSARLTCQYVMFDGLPYNPLIPMPITRPGSGKQYLAISEHVNGLVDVLKRTFSLGDQQEVAVKNAIRECFEESGIPAKGTIEYGPSLRFPDFNDIGEKLKQSNGAAYNRLDPLFDLGIFRAESKAERFDNVLNASQVIDLSQIQDDKIKNAIAKILVMSAHRYYNAREHSGSLRQFLVFDEAHRILDSAFMAQFVRECRAYGVGVLLSSQYPSDFPADISASLNTKILHGNGADRDRVRDIAKMLGNTVDELTIANLGMFDAIVTNSQVSPAQVRCLAYPLLLVYQAISARQGSTVENLVVEGLDSKRLNISFLVDTLIEMGLVLDSNLGLTAVVPRHN